MRLSYVCALIVLTLSGLALAQNQEERKQPPPPAQNGGDFSGELQPVTKVPTGVILVKGAWSSASDSTTPVPEGGSVSGSFFSDPYFGMSFTLPADWYEKHKGPPPSDRGLYVLTQVRTAPTYKGPAQASMLITAQDMFFTPLPAANARELVSYKRNNLQADYKVELPLTETSIGGHPFTFFAYWSPSAELHWYVLATEIRCHAVELSITSRDTKLLGDLLLDIAKLKLPAEASPTGGAGGGAFPVCIKDYAKGAAVIARVDPIFTERRFNSVPVRIMIDKEGRVKHTHILSGFPEQSRAIIEAMKQWRFKPYLVDGKPVEVETGILFGRTNFVVPRTGAAGSTSATQ